MHPFRRPLICALDSPEVGRARALARAVAPYVGGVKLGLEFFLAHGPAGVRDVMADSPLPLFLDVKLHDIPNTVAGAVRAAAALKSALMTVHACGGYDMLRAAVEAASEASGRKPRLLAVTVLTSLDQQDMETIGVDAPVQDQVLRLAALAQRAGLDGVICSPQEIDALRRECGEEFLLVVPGIRPAGSAHGDQKRVLTPKAALAHGADLLVIGRPITHAPDPAAAAAAIMEGLELQHG